MEKSRLRRPFAIPVIPTPASCRYRCNQWTATFHYNGERAKSSADCGRHDAIADQCDVRACLHGDPDAYGGLIRRHQQSVGSLLWRFTHDRLEHEILVHDVFVEAYFSLRTYRATGAFRSWLLTIATRVGYGLWKQRARTRRRNVVSIDRIPEPPAAGVEPRPEEALDLLGQALARLAPLDRMVLTLLYLEEMSVAEVATLTGWSRTLVKVQAHRARGRLLAAPTAQAMPGAFGFQ